MRESWANNAAWVLLGVLDVPAVIFTVWLTMTLARDGVFGELWRQLLS